MKTNWTSMQNQWKPMKFNKTHLNKKTWKPMKINEIQWKQWASINDNQGNINGTPMKNNEQLMKTNENPMNN